MATAMDKVKSLPYVDIQHDALAVVDDVTQGIVAREDIWVSAYQVGSSSVHGKLRVASEDGEVKMTSMNGVEVEQVSKSNFNVSAPALGISKAAVQFPRQVISPPYMKKSSVAPELTINSIDYSAKSGKLVVGGPDGYCVVLSPSAPSQALELKGHVGDVLSVQWFPSGEVVLTASSDLSVRVFSGVNGVNPRTLKGHTRAVTSTCILGVGREVLSASKDGSVRLWNVGQGDQVKRWIVHGGKAVEALAVVDSADGLKALDVPASDNKEEHEMVILAASPDGTINAFALSSPTLSAPLFTSPPPVKSNLVSMAYSPTNHLIATGHANGVIVVRHLSSLRRSGTTESNTEESASPSGFIAFRRNESPIYSLAFVTSAQSTELLVGTGSGLPCRIAIDIQGETISATTAVEYGGWEAVGVETWAVAPDGVWCAGGEASIRRY